MKKESNKTNGTLTTYPKTLAELRTAQPELLLEMFENSKGHTGKDFKDHFHCEYSYTSLRKEIETRGYEFGWHKVKDVPHPAEQKTIELHRPESTVRRSYKIDGDVAEDWADFNKNIPYKSQSISAALRYFMEAIEAGKLNIEINLR